VPDWYTVMFPDAESADDLVLLYSFSTVLGDGEVQTPVKTFRFQPVKVAEYYQVEISGMAEFADCPDCAALDGVYIMGPMQQIHIDGDPVNCSDGILLPTICADSDEPGCYGLIGLQFYQAGGAFHLLVNLQSGGTPCGQGGGQPSIEWEMDFAPSAPDCLFLDEFGISQPRSLTWITNGVDKRVNASESVVGVAL